MFFRNRLSTTNNTLRPRKISPGHRMMHSKNFRLNDEQKLSIKNHLNNAIDAAKSITDNEISAPSFDYSTHLRQFVYRLISIPELMSMLDYDKVGNKPMPHVLNDFRMFWHNRTKKCHLHLPEHVQESNSTLLVGFSTDPLASAKYAGLSLTQEMHVLIVAALPGVTTIPAEHALLDPAPFNYYHQCYLEEQENHHSYGIISASSGKETNSAILCKQQSEITMIIAPNDHSCDFRPHFNKSIFELYLVKGGQNSYNFVSDKPFYENPYFKHRSYAFRVVCPDGMTNFINMNNEAIQRGLIPEDARLLLLEDVCAAWKAMSKTFPPESMDILLDQQIFNYVPAHYKPGSKEVVAYMLSEHETFRSIHGYNETKHSILRRFGMSNPSSE